MKVEYRYVWYIGNEAVSYKSLHEGLGKHGRDPDAHGVYHRLPDGTLEHVSDTVLRGICGKPLDPKVEKLVGL